MNRTAPLAISLKNHTRKVPYDRQHALSDRAYGPARKAYWYGAGYFRQKNWKKHNGYMIIWLLTTLGWAGRENIWLSVRTHGPRYARSRANCFPVQSSQSISTYSSPLDGEYWIKQLAAKLRRPPHSRQITCDWTFKTDVNILDWSIHIYARTFAKVMFNFAIRVMEVLSWRKF